MNRETSEVGVQLYINASKWVKNAVAAKFKLQQPLYFSYTHLVCRTAKEGEFFIKQECDGMSD